MRKFKKLSLFLVVVMLFTSLPLGVFAEDTHVVEEGEFLWKIAEKYDLDYNDLAAYNDIEDPNMIYAGTSLKIPGKDMKKITVLGTADLHGRIYSYEYAIDSEDKDAGIAKIATLVKAERAKSDNVLLMDMGDTVQDNSAELFNNDDIHPMVEAMNFLDYDVWTIGNHEFNFEKSFLENNIDTFEGTVLSANTRNLDGSRFVDGYKVFDIDGVRVAVIGLLPPNIPVWEAAAPEHFEGLKFTGTVEEAQLAIKELEGKYDVLIGAFHLGEDDDHNFKGARSVAEACPEFDAIFMGHAHSKVSDLEVNGVKLIEPGKYGWALAKAEITVIKENDKYVVSSVTTENLETYNVEEDADVLAKFKDVHETSINDAKTVVGQVTEDYVTGVDFITGEAEVTTMPRTQMEDTALIDLINDVQMFYTNSQISSAAAFKSDMNLVAGDFMKKDVANIYKYPNTLMGVNITGKNLKSYMEWSASYYNTYAHGDVTISFDSNIRGYNYDMFSGVEYDIDISKPAGERITNLELDGEEIVDDQVYKLAVNNYRFGTLLGLELVTEDDKYFDSYAVMQDAGRIRDLIIKYIQEEKAGKAEPSVNNNWKIIGADLNHPLKDDVLNMIINGELTIPRSEDGRTPNVKSLNVYELMQEGTLEEYTEVTILHTNDMHGFFKYGKYDGMGAPLLAAKIKLMKELNENTLLLDAGDAIQGHNLVTLSKGENAVKVLNKLGYDAMTAGNHEFDYSSERLNELTDMLEYPVLSANVKKADGTNLLTPYIIKEMNGLKIGIFGLSTPETKYKSHPDNTEGLTFEDPKVAAAAMVAELKDQTDIIIAITHLGIEGDLTSISVAEAVDGIDVIVDGHSHTKLSEGQLVNGTLIVQAEEKTKNLGIVKLLVKDGVVTDKISYLYTKSQATNLTPDSEMEALVEELVAANEIIEKEVVATTPEILDGEREQVRVGETNLGNLIAEAFLEVSGADIALTNGGGIRASINVGEVTKGEVLTVLPYGNTVRVIELTGADVLAAIENGVSEFPESNGAYPHIAGMTVEFDSTKEAGSRVTKVMIAGVILDETKTYTLVTNDFLVAGGDDYTMFKGKTVTAEFGAMDEVLIDYLNTTGFEKSTITDRIKDVSSETSYISINRAA